MRPEEKRPLLIFVQRAFLSRHDDGPKAAAFFSTLDKRGRS
ncbi:protein of unknown function [Xenorhabdus nematophila AN6/1]|nr:protein of unknown function [Xenorhabdus nematophila AN6/1]